MGHRGKAISSKHGQSVGKAMKIDFSELEKLCEPTPEDRVGILKGTLKYIVQGLNNGYSRRKIAEALTNAGVPMTESAITKRIAALKYHNIILGEKGNYYLAEGYE